MTSFMIWFQDCWLIAAVDSVYCGGETAFWKTQQIANIIYKVMHVVYVIFCIFFFGQQYFVQIITLNIFHQQREKRICKVGLSLPFHLFFYNWSHCSLRQTDGLSYSPAWNRISPQLILMLKSNCIILYLNLQKVFFFLHFLPIPYFFPPFLLSWPVSIQPHLLFPTSELWPYPLSNSQTFTWQLSWERLCWRGIRSWRTPFSRCTSLMKNKCKRSR